jgi:hypothetical protein
MSEIDSCERDSDSDSDSNSNSDDNGEWSNKNAASVPSLSLSRKRSLPLSKKRLRDKEESFHDAHPRNENGRVLAFVVAGSSHTSNFRGMEVEVPTHKKRRGAVRSKASGKNDAAGKCAQILKGVEATEEAVVVSEDAQVTDHHESHEGIDALIAAASSSEPINSEPEQTSPDDRSANKRAYKRSQKVPPKPRSSVLHSIWEERLSELAVYCKTHGNCNVSKGNKAYSTLANWVATQRKEYKLHVTSKASHMTLPRIQELESLGFEWRVCLITWEDRLSELADYRVEHGHCNVPKNFNSKISNLGEWIKTQRTQYRLHLEGKTSPMNAFRIRELESLGFEWDSYGAAWEDRLSELADFCKIHGHCNVPKVYSGNPRLGRWVGNQRNNYRLHLDGKASPMNDFRIQELESVGLEWEVGVSWEDRLSELADFRNKYGHCNATKNYSGSVKLGRWVGNQRTHYKALLEGKKTILTTFRVQQLESLGFEWMSSVSRGRGKFRKKKSKKIRSTSLSNPNNPTSMPDTNGEGNGEI